VLISDRETDRAIGTIELLIRAVELPPATTSPTRGLPDLGSGGIDRGKRLFRYLAHQAQRRKGSGSFLCRFIALLFNKPDFKAVVGRGYLPSDSGPVIEIARLITAAADGRLPLTRGASSISSGMDTFIWEVTRPFARPDRAWQNPKHPLPYSREEWLAVFPDEERRLITPKEANSLL